MINISIKGDREMMRALEPKRLERAAELSVNDTARKVKPEGSRRVRAIWNVKAKDLNRHFKMKLAKNGDLSAVLFVSGRPMSLAKFGAKGVRDVRGGVVTQTARSGRFQKRSRAARGVTVEIERGKKTRLPHAFLATVAAGRTGTHVGVFEREVKGKSHHRRRPWSLPIVERQTITVPAMFAQRRIQKGLDRFIDDHLAKNLNRHMARFLGR